MLRVWDAVQWEMKWCWQDDYPRAITDVYMINSDDEEDNKLQARSCIQPTSTCLEYRGC